MKKHILFFTLSILFSGLQLLGQNVSGTIVDENGEGVIGATILVRGSTQGTTTDFDGNFNLEVPTLTDTLEISYVGYEQQVIPINLRNSIDVVMSLNANEMDEIVVVGYGRQKKRLVTGAISRVSEEDIKATPIPVSYTHLTLPTKA